LRQRCTLLEWEQLKALTRTELIGQDRLEFILGKGLWYLIRAWAPKCQITLEHIMDCMLAEELDEIQTAELLDKACGTSTEASPEDLAAIQALMAKWN